MLIVSPNVGTPFTYLEHAGWRRSTCIHPPCTRGRTRGCRPGGIHPRPAATQCGSSVKSIDKHGFETSPRNIYPLKWNRRSRDSWTGLPNFFLGLKNVQINSDFEWSLSTASEYSKDWFFLAQKRDNTWISNVPKYFFFLLIEKKVQSYE